MSLGSLTEKFTVDVFSLCPEGGLTSDQSSRCPEDVFTLFRHGTQLYSGGEKAEKYKESAFVLGHVYPVS